MRNYHREGIGVWRLWPPLFHPSFCKWGLDFNKYIVTVFLKAFVIEGQFPIWQFLYPKICMVPSALSLNKMSLMMPLLYLLRRSTTQINSATLLHFLSCCWISIQMHGLYKCFFEKLIKCNRILGNA